MKIVIGGQVEKKEIEKLIKAYDASIETVVKSDLEAAMMMKQGQADYYFGACHTGGGGALAMAISLLGKANCHTISMPGKPPVREKVEKAVQDGGKAFGFTGDHKEKAVEYLLGTLKA
ncbi:DUF2620 domain-containing protein [Shouchella shacheensis]|uniref:DUF2620 domain-containing protein n=1 Tax=Shouchella shacheensis TaxID=1649580 RepID=UPI00074032F1|nr:DUF2620 domain-containing protein [Shouchella shacheensis]